MKLLPTHARGCLGALAVALLGLAAGCQPTDPVGFGGPPGDSTEVYRIVPLVQPQVAQFSVAYDLNDEGHVVGSIEGRQSVLWTLQGSSVRDMLVLDPPGREPEASEARAVNARGQVVGWFREERTLPYLWTPEGGMQELPLPEGLSSGVAYGIADDGRVVGSGAPDPDFTWTEGGRVLVWTVDAAGVVTDLADLGTLGGVGARGHALNHGGQIVGSIWPAGGDATTAFLWSEQTGVQELPLTTEALALNDRAEIAGAFGDRAAIWMNGSTVPFGPSGSVARDINAAGDVVGEIVASNSRAKSVPFLWLDGDLVQLETPSQADHARARAINAAGVVVGESYVPGVNIGEAAIWIRD